MNNLLHAAFAFVTGLWFSVLIFSYLFTPQTPLLAAALPQSPAVFETSLQSGITSSATSMTLTANAVRGGSTLSGYNCFTIDEGSAQAEYVCGTVSSTAVTAMSRGINPATGTTTAATLQFSHRRGANVKVTDFPVLQILKAQANGEDTYPSPLKFDAVSTYTSAPSFTSGSNQLASVLYAQQYANAVISGGAPTSTELVGGKVILATRLQAASSTDGGVASPFALSSKISTSSSDFATSSVVVTEPNGKIKSNLINLTSTYVWTALHTFSNIFVTGSSTLAASASNKLTINGVPLVAPSFQGASSTVWGNNGSGVYTPMNIGFRSSISSTCSTTATATTTCGTIAITASSISTIAPMRVTAQWADTLGRCYYIIQLGTGLASTTVGWGASDIGLAQSVGHIFATSTASGSATFATDAMSAINPNQITTAAFTPSSFTAGAYLTHSFTGTLYLSFSVAAKSGEGPCGFTGAVAETLPSF